MDNESEDMALAAFLASAKLTAADLPEDLLRKAYSIQRSHQFDSADKRETSMQDTLRLLESYADSSESTK